MARIFDRVMVEVYITPTQLREIADELERKVKYVQIGDPLPRSTLHDDGVTVVLVHEHHA